MIEGALALHDAALPVFMQFFATFLRIGGMMLLVPGLGDRMIPVRVSSSRPSPCRPPSHPRSCSPRRSRRA